MSYFKSMHKGDRVCVNCRFFYQHYVRTSSGFVECNAGHCYCQRKYAHSKCRKPGDEACEKFAEEVTPYAGYTAAGAQKARPDPAADGGSGRDRSAVL